MIRETMWMIRRTNVDDKGVNLDDKRGYWIGGTNVDD